MKHKTAYVRVLGGRRSQMIEIEPMLYVSRVAARKLGLTDKPKKPKVVEERKAA